MKRILLFTLVNTAFFHNVSCLNPNVFWKRARTMTKNIGSNVYKRTKTAIIPIVAKIKNTNGGFYEGNSNNNENLGYNDYIQSATRYSNPQQMTNQQQHFSDGLYQDYRRSLSDTQNYAPAPAPVYMPPAPAPVYMPPAPAPVYMPPAPAPVYTQTGPTPTSSTPAPTSLYAPPPSAYTPPVSAPTPVSEPPSTASQYNHGLAMSRYAHSPGPVSPPAPVPAPVPVAPVSTPAPVSTVEKKEYSTEGLYEEYRKSLQKTNPDTENPVSLNTQNVNTGRSSRNTASGFYSGPNKSSTVKEDTILYEPPAVVKSPPYLERNRYSGSGFYQGR